MNQDLKLVAAAVAVAFVASGLYPPWLCYSSSDPAGSSLGWAFLFDPPRTAIAGPSPHIDLARLAIEWVVIASGGVAAALLAARWRQEQKPGSA